MIVPAKVDFQSGAYKRMAPHWSLVDDLRGGTMQMQKVGKTWLPQEYLETQPEYDVRLNRTILSNYYEDTLKKISGKPFSRPVTVENLPEKLEPMLEDVDGTAKTLTQFCKEAFMFGIHHGMTGLYVDYPSLEDVETKKDEDEAGARPYLNLYKGPQIYSFRVVGIDLTQVVFEESTVEYPETEFGEVTVVKFRVVRDHDWELWRPVAAGGNEYEIEAVGMNTLGKIPLIMYYVNREGFMEATPALEDLGYANLEHWQRKSDYSNLLHYTGMATLFMAGVDNEFIETYKAIGTNKLMATSNEQANGQYLEISGAGATALRAELLDIQDRMMIHAMQPLVSRTGSITATERAIDEGASQSDLQAWIRGLEDSVTRAFELAAEWEGLELPEDFAVNIYNDFGISMRGQEDIKSLLDIRLSGNIDHETFLREMKRRGVVHESEIIDDIVARAELEDQNNLKGIMDADKRAETKPE